MTVSLPDSSIREAVAEYCHAHKHLSVDTRRNSKQRLLLFTAFCEEHGVSLETLKASHVRDFLDEVGKRTGMQSHQVKPSTVKSYTQTVKAFLHWCVQEGEYDVSPKVAERVELPKVEQTVIEVFTPEQITALFDACEKRPYPVRDRAILAVLLDTGIRASELVGLTLDCTWLDVDDSFIKVMGKGRKQREIPLGRTSRLALRRYITRYRHPHNKGERRVFLAGNTGLPITRSGLHQIVAEIGWKAHIKGVRCSPHTFRHTFACMYLLSGGGDMYKLSRLLGHSQAEMSEVYLRAITARQARQGNQSVLDHLKDL
jgi:integrase/recombinase XerD